MRIGEEGEIISSCGKLVFELFWVDSIIPLQPEVFWLDLEGKDALSNEKQRIPPEICVTPSRSTFNFDSCSIIFLRAGSGSKSNSDCKSEVYSVYEKGIRQAGRL